ncbi:MAG: flagellar biosynthetic protein FliQ [Holosporales bacterium]
MGAPMLLVGLTVGIIISFLQALTQIQEMTLSFVPKILATFAVLLFSMPFIAQTLKVFTERIFDQMVGLQ